MNHLLSHSHRCSFSSFFVDTEAMFTVLSAVAFSFLFLAINHGQASTANMRGGTSFEGGYNSSRALSRGSYLCVNQVDVLEVIVTTHKRTEWTTVECANHEVENSGAFPLQFDRLSKKPCWLVCPLMFDSFTKCSSHGGTLFRDNFKFRCENQVETVTVIGEDETEVNVQCTNETFKEPNNYCLQFDLETGINVWQVCPMACPFSGCQKCVNKVDSISVLGGRSNQKVVPCEPTPGVESIYCRQFNAFTSNLVYLDCPLMCPEFNGCDNVY